MTHPPSQMPEIIYVLPVSKKHTVSGFYDIDDSCGTKYTRATSVPCEDERLKELSAQLIKRGYVDAKFYDGVTKRDAIEMIEAVLAGKTKPFTPFNDSTHTSVPSDKEPVDEWDRLAKIKADVSILKNAYARFADQYEQDRFDRIIKCAEYLASRAPDQSETIKALKEALEKATDQLESALGGRIHTKTVNEILERKALSLAEKGGK